MCTSELSTGWRASKEQPDELRTLPRGGSRGGPREVAGFTSIRTGA